MMAHMPLTLQTSNLNVVMACQLYLEGLHRLSCRSLLLHFTRHSFTLLCTACEPAPMHCSSSGHAARRSTSAPRMSTPSFSLVHRRAPTPSFGPPPAPAPARLAARTLHALAGAQAVAHAATDAGQGAAATAVAAGAFAWGGDSVPGQVCPPAAAAAAAAAAMGQLTAGRAASQLLAPAVRRAASAEPAVRRSAAAVLGSRAGAREVSPGPGDYAVEDDWGVRGAVSTARRPPAAVFPVAPRSQVGVKWNAA